MPLAKRQVFILVKAYPQPSQKYEETVCCAGITAEGEFVRLYPVRYRHLAEGSKFDRFDLIEVMGERPRGDGRPESFHIDENSIRVVRSAKTLTSEQKAALWLKSVSISLEELRSRNKSHGVSLGIVKPDIGSMRFSAKPAHEASNEDKAISDSLLHQNSLLESPLKPLPAPEYGFYYRYTSAGKKSEGRIHDWEVQAAYGEYKRRYGTAVLEEMRKMYQETIPAQNLHLILGTMQAHPQQFIIIGLLRTTASIEALKAQSSFFD